MLNIGFLTLTYRTLCVLATLGVFAGASAILLKRANIKQPVKAICFGLFGFYALGKCAYMLLGKPHTLRPFSGGFITLFGLFGYILGIFIAFNRNTDKFKRAIKSVMSAFIPFAGLMYAFESGAAGVQAKGLSLFSVSDANGLYSVVPGRVAGACILGGLVLMFAACRIFKGRFKPNALAAAIFLVGLLAPSLALRVEAKSAFAAELVLLTLLESVLYVIYGLKRLSDVEFSANQRAFGLGFCAISPLVTAVLILFKLFAPSLIFSCAAALSALSPVFPFVKRRKHSRKLGKSRKFY